LRHVAVIALLLCTSLACAQTPRFDPARDAAADVAAAVAAANSQHKRVLVDVGGEWCEWCHLLDDLFAGDGALRDFRDAHYVVVKVNWSRENHNDAVLSRWPKIPGFPHLFVLDQDGKLVHSQPTEVLEKGHGYDRDRVMAFLRRYAG
jgi:thiol:disulfide interchange protein